MPYPDNYDEAYHRRATREPVEVPDASAYQNLIRLKIAELSVILTQMERLYAWPPPELDDAQGFLTEVQECVDAAIKNEPDRARDRRSDAL